MFGKTIIATVVALGLVAAAPITENVEKRVNHDGQATWFEVGLGACGWWNGNSDMIVALNSGQYESNNGGNCGQWLEITNTNNGKKVNAYVADECPTCAWGSLDMSPAVFSALTDGDMGQGVFPISWHFRSKGWSP